MNNINKEKFLINFIKTATLSMGLILGIIGFFIWLPAVNGSISLLYPISLTIGAVANISMFVGLEAGFEEYKWKW